MSDIVQPILDGCAWWSLFHLFPGDLASGCAYPPRCGIFLVSLRTFLCLSEWSVTLNYSRTLVWGLWYNLSTFTCSSLFHVGLWCLHPSPSPTVYIRCASCLYTMGCCGHLPSQGTHSDGRCQSVTSISLLCSTWDLTHPELTVIMKK